ncbi:MAG TPA: SoxY-related AACIE arm protein [Burkholderiaceae bacterium]|jgi:sulfur-oxidizing protein SoxY|nr:SoxY-related AACIE arm protein [Burkholderiaceae bacterium]
MKRRDFLVVSGLAAASSFAARPARATAAEAKEAILKLTAGATIKEGRVTLDLPPLVENGNSVPLTVSVDSPMSAADHVKAIHVFVEKNPQPFVAAFLLGPRAGRAVVSTRIRLADSQSVVAICQMSDGSFWSGSADSVVTLAACTESE